MAVDIRLIVVDAAPLITLATAKSLDYLLYSSLPLLIPDAVFHEATAAAGKLGAQEIIEWYRTNTAAIRVEPTEIFQREMRTLEIAGGRLPRDLGERAALVRAYPLADREQALLISDDRDAARLIVVDPARIVLLTTWDYLRQLESAQRIQSADAIMAAAREAGRNPPLHELWSRHDHEIRDAVRAILSKKPT